MGGKDLSSDFIFGKDYYNFSIFWSCYSSLVEFYAELQIRHNVNALTIITMIHIIPLIWCLLSYSLNIYLLKLVMHVRLNNHSY